MATSNHTNDHYETVCEQLLLLDSWTEDQKTCLLDIMTDWTTKFEHSMSTQLNTNMWHLLELLSHNVSIVPLLPVETIFKIIQSDNIPAEAWLDCIIAIVESPLDNNDEENIISFDFKPVTIPTTLPTSSVLKQELPNDRSSSLPDHFSHEAITFLTQKMRSSSPSVNPPTTTMNIFQNEEPLEEYRTILLDNLEELYQLQWDQSSVQSLRDTFTNPQNNNIFSIKTALLVVETIVTNRISLRLHIERIVNRITKYSSNKWMEELNQIVEEQGKNKSLQTLLNELGRENSFLNLVDLEQRYRTVMYYYDNQTSHMKLSDIQNEQNYNDEFYKIAVIIQAIYLYKQVRPRDIQILSLLLFIENQYKNFGRLAQIRTGEGKSIIISMLAVYLSLPPLKNPVDIITTSEVLAKRDAEEFKPFYKIFNLTVGDNCCKPSETPNYSVDIIYGTVNQFAGDLLRTEFYLEKKVRGDRPYSSVIVDEVDSMFIDQRQHFTQLASLTPGYKSLNIILKFIFIFFKKYNITEDNQFIIQTTENKFVLIDALKFLEEKLNNKKLIQFPEYRRSYIFSKLPKWIQSARRALYELQIDIDYIINKQNEIVVVDYANTGVSQMNMHWSNGIHQFLQLKHNLRMTPERICDSFYSNVTLFKKYQCLYGLTGTLGGIDAQNFLKFVYKIDVVIIPKYIDSEFDIYHSKFASHRHGWLENIRDECRTIAITNRRAVLIICQTIYDANDVQSYLHSPHSNIKLYLRSDEHTKPEEVNPGDIIVATNLAGRGTDLKVMTTVIDRGGLHVIVTFMPKNSRVEQQAFGRAGRQGQPGSARLIIYKDYENMMTCNEIELIDHWKQMRDKFESEHMSEAIEEVNRIESKDRLLVRFLDIAHSYKNDLPFTEDIFKPGFSSLRELWSTFCDDDHLSTANQRFPSFENDLRQKLESSITTMKQTFPSEESPNENIANAQCNALRQLIVHPKYFIFAGIEMMCMKNVIERKKRTLLLYERALEFDNQDFIIHYNTVLCYIDSNQNSINQAIKAIDTAIELLNNEIERRKLLQIHDDSSTIQQSIAELVYLHYVYSVFNSSREQLQKFDEDKHDITCRCENWKDILTNLDNTQFKDIKNDIQHEYEEWASEGLIWLYTFDIQTKRSWWKTIFIFVMGIAQIVGGVFLYATGHWKIGTSMVLKGTFDIYLSVATKITNDFDLVNYFKDKVINYGIDLLCISPNNNLSQSIVSLEQLRIVGIDGNQLYTKESIMDTLNNLAFTAINIAGLDKNSMDFFKQIQEKYKNIEVLFSRDFDRISNSGTSMIVDRFLGMLDKDCLFEGKSKEIFRIIQHHTPIIKHIYDGNNQAVISYALNNINEILPKLPIIDLISIGIPKTVDDVVVKEQLNIKNLFASTVNQLNSMKGECTAQTLELIQIILNSSDKWTLLEESKHEFNTKVYQLLRPPIELERQFRFDFERLAKNTYTISYYGQVFISLNVTYGTIQNQRNDIQRAIERQFNDNSITQRAMMEFVDQLCQNSNNKSKNSETTNALKEYLNESIIRPSAENACEQELDQKDEELMKKFTKASAYIQEQRKKFN